MAVKYASISTSTTPVQVSVASDALSDVRERGQHLVITNTGTVAVLLGDSTVTSTVGYSLAANATVRVDLDKTDDVLYAASATAGTLSVLISGV